MLHAALEPTAESREPLTANLIRFLSSCGVMKAAVDAGMSGAMPVR